MLPVFDNRLHDMLSKLERRDFDALNRTTVKVATSHGILELEMFEVKSTGQSWDITKFRDPFSLMFRGPAKVRLAPGVYWMEIPKFGQIPVSLNPVISADQNFIYYQSAWN